MLNCYAPNLPGILKAYPKKDAEMNYPVINNPNEKPLETLLPDGGFSAIFRTIGCIGDSLSSGEFQLADGKGGWTYHDKYDYSWGQFLARMTGATVYNFSAGGMSARWYWESFANEMGCWDPRKKCQAYIIALGVNDLCNGHQEVGSATGLDFDNPDNNPRNFAGYYARIIAKYRMIQKDPFFFLMTMPRSYPHDLVRADYQVKHRDLLREIVGKVPNGFLLDFYEYAPEYDDEFKKNYYYNGHLNPQGYLLTAKMVASYIDYIVRHNMNRFELTGMMEY